MKAEHATRTSVKTAADLHENESPLGRVTHKSANLSHRYRSLDAIRGLASFGVLFFHYRNHFGAAPFSTALKPVYERGAILVDVFFVMSGYLLVTIYAGRRDIGALLWRRAARLVPLHWLMLAVITILQHLIVLRFGGPFVYPYNDAYHFLLNLLLIQSSGLENGFSFDGPAWSVSVEWLVNILLFLLLLTGTKRLPWLGLVLALLATLALCNHDGVLFAGRLYEDWIDALLLRGIVGFFIGVALTGVVPLAPQTDPPFDARVQRVVGHLWDVVLVTSGVALYTFMRSDTIALRPGVDFAVVLVVIPALIAGSVHGRWAARALAFAPFEWLGRISYSVYLVHFPMQALFVLLFPPPDHWLNYGRPSVLGAYIAATLLTSALVWRFVELPAQSFLQRVSVRKPRER